MLLGFVLGFVSCAVLIGLLVFFTTQDPWHDHRDHSEKWRG